MTLQTYTETHCLYDWINECQNFPVDCIDCERYVPIPIQRILHPTFQQLEIERVMMKAVRKLDIDAWHSGGAVGGVRK
jgi:hypothetical protein